MSSESREALNTDMCFVCILYKKFCLWIQILNQILNVSDFKIDLHFLVWFNNKFGEQQKIHIHIYMNGLYYKNGIYAKILTMPFKENQDSLYGMLLETRQWIYICVFSIRWYCLVIWPFFFLLSWGLNPGLCAC